MAGWVRFVWWPLMAVLGLTVVGCLVRSVIDAADGRWGAVVFDLLGAALFGTAVWREAPHWRAVNGRAR